MSFIHDIFIYVALYSANIPSYYHTLSFLLPITGLLSIFMSCMCTYVCMYLHLDYTYKTKQYLSFFLPHYPLFFPTPFISSFPFHMIILSFK